MDSGRIPDYVLRDEELVAQLPVFFRTLSGQKPSREGWEKLVELTKNAIPCPGAYADWLAADEVALDTSP